MLVQLEFFQQLFEKYSSIKFDENPSSASRVVPCGRTDRQMDERDETVTFRYFAQAPPKSIELKLSSEFNFTTGS